MKTHASHSPHLLSGAIAAVLLALTLQANAQTAPAKPALLAAKAASAPAAGAAKPAAAAATGKARKPAGLTGGDDDLKDLEVERVRGKNR
jgi:hypothetical protein